MDATSLAVGAAAGLAIGLLAGIVLALSRTAKERAATQAAEQRAVKAESELGAAATRIEEEKKLLVTAEAKFREVFQAVAAESLRSTRDDYLKAAQERVTGLVKPIDDALKLTRDQAEAMERRRNEAYGSLETQLKLLGEMQERVQQEARNLSTALRRPFVRGRWGEVTLRNLVETAGMSPYCDFEEQVSVDTEEGRLRPDMTVRLPGDRIVVVDAKLPLESYLDAMEATDEAAARQLLANHAAQVHSHVVQLSSKRYFDQFRRSPDFVVMFIPGEAFFGAALEADRGLLEFGMSRRVILASPANDSWWCLTAAKSAGPRSGARRAVPAAWSAAWSQQLRQ